MSNERIEIEDGIAVIYEMKVKGSCKVDELSRELASLGASDTGILPLGTIRVIKQNDGKSVYLLGFGPKKWPDGITHPPILFKFNCNEKRNTISEISVAYADGANFTKDTIIRHTAHRNVFASTKVCLGQAFQMPSQMPIIDRMNLFISMYFLAKNNSDLDSTYKEHMPSELKTWSNVKRSMKDISEKGGLFKEYTKLEAWVCS